MINNRLNRIRSFYFNLSIKYKILVFFYGIVFLISTILGLYSYFTSENYVINKVSAANLEVIRQVNSSINFIQKDIDDISTYMCLDPGVQAMLLENRKGKDYNDMGVLPETEVNSITSALNFITNILASKSCISSIAVYGKNGFPPYFISTDTSTGAANFDMFKDSELYKAAHKLQGTPLWFYIPQGRQDFFENNASPKIAMCRTIKNINGDLSEIGFMVIGINESSIHSLLSADLLKGKESIIITDGSGRIISREGPDFYTGHTDSQKFIKSSQVNSQGYIIDKVSGRNMLVAYSRINGTDWETYYMSPMENLTKEINSIKVFTLILVLACLLLSFPLLLAISGMLTAPIQQLLKTMCKSQEGDFEARVNFKYGDEIGMLGEGYNKMVSNIKELIERVYVLQIKEQELMIKEREAELNALQAQINPHFLYNMLDTIFWKAYGGNQNEQEISNMVFSLSKVFRLNLNRGKGFTSVGNERELVQHYLLLQKIRFKEHLEAEIHIDDEILHYKIPKLIIQPFIENAILHGLEGKEGGGKITVTGKLAGDRLQFVIMDDGVGMDEETVGGLLSGESSGNANILPASGGYAIGNVNERLKLIFSDQYSLNFRSSPGRGTEVEIIIPALDLSEEDKIDDKTSAG